jgi:hypothetical protein
MSGIYKGGLSGPPQCLKLSVPYLACTYNNNRVWRSCGFLRMCFGFPINGVVQDD